MKILKILKKKKLHKLFLFARYFFFFFKCKTNFILIKMVKTMKMKTGGGCAAKKSMKGGAKKPMKGGSKKPMKGGDSTVMAQPPKDMPVVPAAPMPTMSASSSMPAESATMPESSTMPASSNMSSPQAGGASKKSKKSKSASGVVMGWCMKCKKMHEMQNPVDFVAKNGRKMVKGTCAKNGNGMNAIVGN